MARIFNIYFTHDDQVYSAVVSVRQTPFFTEYSLNNLHDHLMQFLPGNKIISRGPDHFTFQNATSDCSQSLMDAIIKAVAEHLHATQA